MTQTSKSLQREIPETATCPDEDRHIDLGLAESPMAPCRAKVRVAVFVSLCLAFGMVCGEPQSLRSMPSIGANFRTWDSRRTAPWTQIRHDRREIDVVELSRA